MSFAQAHAGHLDSDTYHAFGDGMPKLYEWQEDHCSALTHAIETYGYAKDGSDTGTGKTIVALETARRLALVPFVIAPKSVIPAWKRWYKEFFPYVEEPFVFNYEKLRTGKTPFVKKVGKRFKWQVKHQCLLIFDEDHKCKGDKSLNSALLTGAAYDRRHTLLLGATSCTDPTEMKALGFALGLHKGSNWWNWCLKNGCVRGQFGGLDFVGGRLHLKKLHDQIYSEKGSRLRTKEIPDFPETLITAEGYEVGFPEHIDLVYKELADLAQQSEGDTDPDNPLTKQLRLRQEIELMKAPIFADLATNAIEEGGAVAVFVSFRATLEKVIELLKKYMPLTLKGGDTEDERQSAVDSFGVFSRCIVCTISAGGLGISLHDEHGTFPRVSIISPSFSAIELKQALGRVHRAGAKTKSVQRIVFAANTVEEKVCSRVRQKLNNIDLINDDELNPIL
jgi:superfamily II DNA or RNA helicase